MKRRRELLAKLGYEQLDYGFSASLEKFDLDGLLKHIERIDSSGRGARHDKAISAVAPTRDRSLADYHVHFHCHWTKRELHAQLEYYPEPEAHGSDDKGPFAEDMIKWIGQFFKSGKVTAHVTASFDYSDRKRSVNVPLPMRLSIGGFSHEVNVVGMVTSLPSKPGGIYEAFVSLAGHRITVILQGNRPVLFSEFNVYDDAVSLAKVAGMFTREAG